MRWLFLIVLTLNLGYIVWQTGRDGPSGHVNVEPLTDVEPIVLLRELRAENAVVVTDVDDEAAAERQDELQQETGDITVQPPASEPSEAVKSVAAVSAPTAAEPSSVEESASRPTAPVAEGASNEAASPAASANAARCFTLGPFRDLDKLRSLTREIKSYVVKADFRGKEEKEQSLYWVYLKPEKTHAKAVATGKRLKARKIKDYYVIRDGEKRHGISLGHFRNKNGAYGLAKRVSKLGFDVLVEPVFKTYTIYWLDYELASSTNIPESIFASYTKADSKHKVSRLSRSCEGA